MRTAIQKRLISFLLLSFIVLINGVAHAGTLPPLGTTNNQATSSSLAPMLKQVMTAVVNIAAQGEIQIPRNPFKPESQQPSHGPKFNNMGSGVIVDAQRGYILTNAHVIRESKYITVTLNDGRHFTATLLGADDASDIAVLAIKADNLTALPLANSSNVQVGDYVVAIGSPFDLKQSVTSGIVSAIGRNGLGIEGYEDFIQTDAPINPGNSGGALVNMQGELVGINTAILSASGANIGIGFAIPTNMAESVLKQLIKYGNVQRGIIGIMVQDLTPALADAFQLSNTVTEGAIVTSVSPETPAAAAQMQVGDVVVKINDTPIRNAADVRNSVGLLRVGSSVTVQAIRAGQIKKFTMSSVDPSQVEKANTTNNPYLAGVYLKNFNQITPIQGHVYGVQVLGVSQSSPAWRSGLRPGDVILSINQKPVKNLNELSQAVKNNSNSLLLNVLRTNAALFIVLK